MKSFNKYFIFITSAIILSLCLLSGCTENSIKDSDKDIPEKTDIVQEKSSNITTSEKTDIVSYCAKEKTEENRIYFNYPQFKESVVDTRKLNEIIIAFVESTLQEMCEGGFKGNLKDSPENWKWDNTSYLLQAMNINYKIERNDLDYFSVTFEGDYNNKEASHPINYFNSLTIDLKKREPVTLSDLYRIDTDFVSLIQKKLRKQIQSELLENEIILSDEIPESVKELLSYDNTLLLDSLHQANKNSDYGFYSFLTDTALGISIPLEHVIGNHFEIMIAYEELESFKI